MVNTGNRVKAIINSIRNWFRALPGNIRGAISSIAHILLAPFTAGYNSIHSVINRIKGAANALTGGINIGGITNKLTQPFRNAYNSIVRVVNQIKAKANSIPVIGGAFGGEDLPLGGAYGGEDLTSTQVSSIEKMEIHTSNDVNLSLDLKNVPSNIDENVLRNALVESLTDKSVLSVLVNNNDFQSLDNRAKARILARNNRARGV
jgi:hypothetical protein